MHATPIDEIAQLRTKAGTWSTLTVAEANQKLGSGGSGPLDVKLQASIESGDGLAIRYDGSDLTTIASEDLENGRGQVEVLIDKGIAEVFVDGGARYITRELPLSDGSRDLELSVKQKASVINHLEIYEMKSMWKPRTIR
jgi:sucrose-6-phosphate hydrolase SacC (GH32 family)